MMVCRGALVKRRAAQGRVGDLELPRQVARHLVSHPLLSANTSAPTDVVRPHSPIGTHARFEKVVAGSLHTSYRAAQPVTGSSPIEKARDTELVEPRSDVALTSACEEPRGKGVLAA
jgi:hypothetical protein